MHQDKSLLTPETSFASWAPVEVVPPKIKQLSELGALSGNDLNNATQFSLSFRFKDIVVPKVNRCGVGHVIWGGGSALWRDLSCLRHGVEAELGAESAGTVQDW